jgi:hypothetical protein
VTLRARAAWAALVLCPLLLVLPVAQGLTHILTCDQPARVAFAFGPGTHPATGSALSDAPDSCRGLGIQIAAVEAGPRMVSLSVSLSNSTALDWRGTAALDVSSVGTVPIPLGRVSAGSTREASLSLRLPPGRTDVSGDLLIGP